MQLIKSMMEQVREVKVVVFLENASNPFAGMVCWSERLSDVSFKGKYIWHRSLRLVNLQKSRGRRKHVGSQTTKDKTIGDGKKLFETMERHLK